MQLTAKVAAKFQTRTMSALILKYRAHKNTRAKVRINCLCHYFLIHLSGCLCMFLAATLGQLLASTCNPMLSAQVFLRLGNHAGKYLPFFFPILPGLFLYHWQLCIFQHYSQVLFPMNIWYSCFYIMLTNFN